jgi:hypothetical protein
MSAAAEALADAERDLDILRPALAAAEGALRAAAQHPIPGADLPALRHARERARGAVAEAEARLPALRAAVAVEDQHQRQAAEADRQRQAAEARRAEDERKRAHLAARLAGPLSTLAAAATRYQEAGHTLAATRATVPVLDVNELVALVLDRRPPEARALDGALVRAGLLAEDVNAAAGSVAALDPTRPEVRQARALVDAAAHLPALADLGPAVALLGAARALLGSAMAEIDRVVTAHPGINVVDLAHGLARLDAAASPPPRLANVGAWLGVGAREAEALALLAAAAKVNAPGMVPSEAGRAALSGQAHALPALSAERGEAATLAARVAATDNARGPVAAAKAAAVELRHCRASGRWLSPTREEHLAATVKAGVDFIAGQLPEQIMHQGGERGPFMVATSPGGDRCVRLSNTRPTGQSPRPGPARQQPTTDAEARAVSGFDDETISAKEQIVAYLGIAGMPEAALVPDITLASPRPDPMAELARGAARSSVIEDAAA